MFGFLLACGPDSEVRGGSEDHRDFTAAVHRQGVAVCSGAEENPQGAEGYAAVLGQGCLHARCVQTVLGSRRAGNWGVPQLQFWTKWTCPLLRRQVHGGAVLEHG